MDTMESVRRESTRLEHSLEALVHKFATEGVRPELKLQFEILQSQLHVLQGPVEHFKKTLKGAEHHEFLLWSVSHAQAISSLKTQARAFINSSLTPIEELEERLL